MEKVIKIVLETLEGRLQSLDRLYNLWPESLKENIEFFEEIYDDIESVIEHSEVNVGTKLINESLFQKNISYRYLVIDYVVLISGKKVNEMIVFQNELKKKKIINYMLLQNYISVY